MPDVYKKFEPQPDDNDSSDYGAEVEDSELIDEEASNSSIEEHKSRKRKKKVFSKKSIKSAHPKMEKAE